MALRILSREHSGLNDLLCAEGVGVVLKKAGLKGGAAQSGFGEKEKLEIDSEWATPLHCTAYVPAWCGGRDGTAEHRALWS